MMEKYWDDFYNTNPIVKEDKWLDKYRFLLNKYNTILDVGCGTGTNECYLKKLNIFPKVCDISHKAIETMKKLHPRCEARVVDIREKMPYYDDEIEIIIADLSLHYFDKETTFKVVKELERILCEGGFIVGRVNATRSIKKDKDFVEIEENFYAEDGCCRRYFSRTDIGEFFCGFNVLINEEKIVNKYGYKKYVIEFLLQKSIV